jgi:Raf kinase inhibitor-like YbhB/YbcL family protein
MTDKAPYQSEWLKKVGISLGLAGLLVVMVGCREPATSHNQGASGVNGRMLAEQSESVHSKRGDDAMAAKTTTLALSSPAFQQHGIIPVQYTCDGKNISPPLTIAGVPPEAKTLALIVHDPDAPGGNWDHWLLWNIPSDTKQIEEGQVPAWAVAGMNDFKQQAYGGPCPPSGTHRYIFTLAALDSPLRLSSGARRQALEQAMDGHIIAKTELIGVYRRQ